MLSFGSGEDWSIKRIVTTRLNASSLAFEA